jgi:hypothetical protein
MSIVSKSASAIAQYQQVQQFYIMSLKTTLLNSLPSISRPPYRQNSVDFVCPRAFHRASGRAQAAAGDAITALNDIM